VQSISFKIASSSYFDAVGASTVTLSYSNVQFIWLFIQPFLFSPWHRNHLSPNVFISPAFCAWPLAHKHYKSLPCTAVLLHSGLFLVYSLSCSLLLFFP